MSERGTRLMVIADSQLSEMIEFFGTLNEVDLHKPYPDESTEDRAGDTVGAVAAHMAQGYHFLGKFLQADGYVLGSPATGNRKGSGHPRLSSGCGLCRSTSFRVPKNSI